jgi:uncharacterized membrane protein YfcA
MIDFATLAAVLAAFLCGGLVKGVVGMGMPLAALPILLLALDVKTAVAVMAMPLVVSNLAQGLEGDGTTALIRRLALLLAALVIGIVVGWRLAVGLDEKTILTIVGGIISVIAVISIRPATIVIAPAREAWLGPIIGLASGVLGGLSALFGPLLAIYLVGIGLGREAFVKGVSILYFTASSVLLLLSADMIGARPAILVWAAIGLVPMFGGMMLGRVLRQRIHPETFRRVVLGVIFLSGLMMLRRGLS